MVSPIHERKGSERERDRERKKNRVKIGDFKRENGEVVQV